MLQNLPAGSEGLCRIEDAFGMPHRTNLCKRPNLFTGLRQDQIKRFLWCTMSDNSCCQVVWQVSFNIHLFIKKKHNPKQKKKAG